MTELREPTNLSEQRQPGGRAGLAMLLVAYALFTLGSMVTIVAVPWLVLTTTGSATKMGVVAAATTVPFLFTSVFATPAADRLGMQATVIVTSLGGALSMAVVAIVPDINFGVLLAMVAVSGGLNGVGGRAQHVMLRPMGEAAGMPMIRVTAIYDGLNNVAMLTGAPLGGLLIYLFGAQGAIWADAAAMAACALIVATLVRPPAGSLPDSGAAANERYVAALLQGFRHLWADQLLFGMLLMVTLANVFSIANSAVFVPLWVSDVYGAAPAIGIILGTYSVGVVLGNVIFTAVATKVPQYLTFIVSIVLCTAPRQLILGITDELVYVIVITFASGMTAAAIRPILGAMLYARVPVQLQNRVFGLVAAVCRAGLAVGGIMAGWLVAGLGLREAILISGSVCLLVTIVPLLRYRPSVHGRLLAVDTQPAEEGKQASDDPATERH
ncbi:MAG: MFS transporter [Actinophytocola sp.]|uniref:MFS transporter n=1 Tax=Actinophytocola sp. TaxID=1872138 RepID=UPI0013256827|nr:MFS transporter [Actinophytocola sp.]MPZ81427.1 MFS transporter [Actinophytocola sp.]